MNGVHDMGGMHGFGPVQPEQTEPVFHHPWEGRVYAMRRALGRLGRWNIDSGRLSIEQIPPAEYLRMSYYERWFASVRYLAVARGLISSAELDSGKAEGAKGKPITVRQALDRVFDRRIASNVEPEIKPKFKRGQKVRASNFNPPGHTRLPRYARGKLGKIDRDHGVYVFPDTNADYRGKKRQHVYSVRFEARELWGAQAGPKDCVYIDLWDDYLERA